MVVVDYEDGGVCVAEQFVEFGQLAFAVGIDDDYEVETAERAAFELVCGEVVTENERFCFEEKADLIKDFRFFENIKEVKPAVCPHDTCNCDGLLKIYKEKL